MGAKTRITYDRTEGFPADFAFADVLVAVDSRTPIGLRVVEMERKYLVGANEGSPLANRPIPSFWRAQVVAGFEEMRGVQAETEALGSSPPFEYPSQMRDAVAKTTPLPRRVLQRDP